MLTLLSMLSVATAAPREFVARAGVEASFGEGGVGPVVTAELQTIQHDWVFGVRGHATRRRILDEERAAGVGLEFGRQLPIGRGWAAQATLTGGATYQTFEHGCFGALFDRSFTCPEPTEGWSPTVGVSAGVVTPGRHLWVGVRSDVVGVPYASVGATVGMPFGRVR